MLTKIVSCQQTKSFQSTRQPIPQSQHPEQYHMATVLVMDYKVQVTGQAGFDDYQYTQNSWNTSLNLQTNHWTLNITAEGKPTQLVEDI